jgi:hypothetical protein
MINKKKSKLKNKSNNKMIKINRFKNNKMNKIIIKRNSICIQMYQLNPKATI